ncbi:polysaccharide biosynthesis tyrosine autokinase [Ramlibacter sp.]|uniref:polysaccharide biosynthesis tyrosine autokinase n=1 Tax=Ramlibacter sp. TaxID=1917967 RepID=UPI002FCBEF81
MDLQHLFLVFRSRLAYIVAFAVVFSALGLAAGLLLHRHTATATLLVSSPIMQTDDSRRTGPPPSPAATAVEVLASPRVVQSVIEAVHLTPDHPHAKAWGAMRETDNEREWIAAHLRKDMRFNAPAESNLVTITAASDDREFAKVLANAFANAYQQLSRDVQAESARMRASQLEQGLPMIDAELRDARGRMAEFRKLHPGFNPDDRHDASTGALATLAIQLAQVESELASPAAPDRQDPALQMLQAEVRRSLARWQEASARYGEAHPAYTDAAADLKQAQAALAAATAAAAQTNSRKAGSLRAALRQQKLEAVGQAALHEEYSSFQRSLAAAETSANSTRNALRQARLESRFAPGTAYVFASAVPQPPGATDPLRRAMPLGGALGLLLGCVFALLLEEWSPRVRQSRATMATMGARLLARVPTARDRPGHGPSMLQRGALAPAGATALRASDPDPERDEALGRILGPDGLVETSTTERTPRVRLPQSGRRIEPRLDRVQAGVPPSPTFVVDLHPAHPVAEAIRELRTHVLLEWRRSGDRRPVCLQSLQHGDGRTFVACNLAIAFAQANLRTLLVDLDLRSPSLSELFGFEPGAGVTGLLMGKQATPRTVDSRGLLDVLAAGPRVPNPQELISGGAIANLLGQLNERYEAVIVDGPAWGCGADAQLLASAGADVVLVAHSDHTPLRELQGMRSRLAELQVRVLGVVTNEH